MSYDPTFPRAHYDAVADKEWTRLTRSRRVERELAWSKLPGTLDLGDNIVYVIRKRQPTDDGSSSGRG